ncbi:hypothetical protein AFLA_007416 [Aspergillus flavus NRRL3357]|nr:hypothetical protein AFLA_007416 [Aspergillus flavus NRRL3357]
MSTYQGYPFQFSEPVETIGPAPDRFYSTLPVRVSKFSDQIRLAGEKAKETLPARLGIDSKLLIRNGTLTSCGHVVSWMLPECPPHLIPSVVELAELICYLDDITDTLDKHSHDMILADVLAAVSAGKFATSECSFVPDALATLSSFFDIWDLSTIQTKLKECFSVQTAHVDKTMSFDQYKIFKINHSGMRFMASIISLTKGQRVSPQEIDSVSYFVDKILLSSSLLNDLYSFPKEFEEHSSAGNMDTIGNAMALLMSGYGYNEDEAANILKREISELEERALEEFHAWQNSNLTRSPSLVGYVFTVMTAAGGFNYWMSHSERYFRTDFTTTAEDRARLVRNPDSCLGCLQGYPAPLALNGHSTSTVELDAVSESHVSGSDSSLTSMTTASSHVSVDGLGFSGMEIGITDKFQKADAQNLCMDPYNYISSLPGKGTVAKLADTLQTWFKVPAGSTEIIKTCSTILFHSSLMLDDIQDDSSKRRGMPAAHVMYGVGQTVNCVSYTGAKAFFLCEELKNANACRKALYDELDNLFSGQALELHWKFHRTCPSMNDYIIMIDNKTAGFFRLVLRMMAAEASVSMSLEKKNTLLHFITLLGRYYQIRDDYQNLVSDEYAAKKGFCDDLSEGKFSLILIHTLNNSPTADRIRGLMFGGDRAGMSQEIRSYILSEMEAAGSLEYTKRIITELYETLWRMLDELEATLGPNTLLRALVQFLKI